MPNTVKLLLTENVDNLGIVGDVVNVKVGYARNYLLPFGYATTPSDELIANLAEKRAQAEKDLAARRAEREEMIGKLDGQELTLVRACNDQGQLYGSVT
jgi:large subunit ribosomal protein L9